jgi:hypothetical protein
MAGETKATAVKTEDEVGLCRSSPTRELGLLSKWMGQPGADNECFARLALARLFVSLHPRLPLIGSLALTRSSTSSEYSLRLFSSVEFL